ncbi:MAG TPA: YggT family protein [Candidatus Limnocylindrales bacterium]|nr:YggT family protein [Candidatus Limnocylindrales bacterium]
MLALGVPLAIVSLISLLITLLIVAILIRVILTYFPGMSYTPLGRALGVATDWIVEPIRRIVPPLGGLDFSPAIAIVLLYAIRILIVSGDLVGALLSIVLTVLLILIILLFVRVFFSFFRMDPWHPVVQMVVRASEPFARPFRGWFPQQRRQPYGYGRSSSGGSSIDLAPIAALVVLLVIWIALNYLNGHRTF